MLRSIVQFVGVLSRFNAFICNFGLWISATAIAGMAILMGIQVFFRYLLNNSLSWAEDVSLMMMAASAFGVLPWAMRHHRHIAITTLSEALPARVTLLVNCAIALLVCVFSMIILKDAWNFAASSTTLASSLPIRMKWIYMALPISIGALIPVSLETALRLGIEGMAPEQARDLRPLRGDL